jgi:hypothetical protein
VEAIERQVPIARPPLELRPREEALAQLEASLGEERFENSRRRGAAIMLDEAIEHALSSLH